MYVSTFQKYSSFQGASLKSRKATKTSHPFDPDILYPLVEVCEKVYNFEMYGLVDFKSP